MKNKKIATYGGGAALLVAGLVTGGILAGSMTANADTASRDGSGGYSAGACDKPNPGDRGKPKRSDEKALTGTTAAKVKAAVLAKYPGATVQRLETDSEGVYEAHVVTDGKRLVVQVGKDFAVTGTQTMRKPPADGRNKPGPRPE